MKLKNISEPVPLKDILDFLVDAKISGSAPDGIMRACGLDSPEIDNSCLTFLRTSDAVKARKAIVDCPASVFLISAAVLDFEIPTEKCVIRVKDPNLAYVKILERFFIDQETQYLPDSVHSTAIISPSAKIDASVKIGAYVVIGENVTIAANTVIHPHVVIYQGVEIGENVVIHANSCIREHCKIGNNCVIQSGAVIGADGFGYIFDPSCGLRVVPQIGIVQLQDNVEVGANSCIDRATSDKTLIEKGSKIDNLVQIGHNVEIGSNSIICGQAGIGGSTKIGAGAVLAGQAGVIDHMSIAAGTRIAGGSIVTSSLDKPGDYAGIPAVPAIAWRKILLATRKLPEIIKKMGKEELKK